MTRAEQSSSEPAVLDRVHLRHAAELEASRMRAHPVPRQVGPRSRKVAGTAQRPARPTRGPRDRVDRDLAQRVLRATDLTLFEFAQAWRLGLYADDPDEEIRRLGALVDASTRTT